MKHTFFNIAKGAVNNLAACGMDCSDVSIAMQYFDINHDMENCGNIFARAVAVRDSSRRFISKLPVSMGQYLEYREISDKALEDLETAVTELRGLSSGVSYSSDNIHKLELFVASMKVFVLLQKEDNANELIGYLQRCSQSIRLDSEIIDNPLVNCFYYAGEAKADPSPCSVTYGYGVNLFMLAVSYGRIDMCEKLFKGYGAAQSQHINNFGNGVGQIAVLDTPDRRMLEWLVQHNLVDRSLQAISQQNPYNTLILSAALMGNTDAMAYILSNNQDRRHDRNSIIVSVHTENGRGNDILIQMAHCYNTLLKSVVNHVGEYSGIEDHCGNNWYMFDFGRRQNLNVSRMLEALKDTMLENTQVITTGYVLAKLWVDLDIRQLCKSIYIRDLLELTSSLLSSQQLSLSGMNMCCQGQADTIFSLLEKFQVDDKLHRFRYPNVQRRPVDMGGVSHQLQVDSKFVQNLMSLAGEQGCASSFQLLRNNIGSTINVTTAQRRKCYSMLFNHYLDLEKWQIEHEKADCAQKKEYVDSMLHYSIFSENIGYIQMATTLYFKYLMHKDVRLTVDQFCGNDVNTDCKRILCDFSGYSSVESVESDSYNDELKELYKKLVQDLKQQYSTMQTWPQAFVVCTLQGEVGLAGMFMQQMGDLAARAVELKSAVEQQQRPAVRVQVYYDGMFDGVDVMATPQNPPVVAGETKPDSPTTPTLRP